jgi:hypothetical protein
VYLIGKTIKKEDTMKKKVSIRFEISEIIWEEFCTRCLRASDRNVSARDILAERLSTVFLMTSPEDLNMELVLTQVRRPE